MEPRLNISEQLAWRIRC